MHILNCAAVATGAQGGFMTRTTFAGILSIGFIFGYLLYYAVRHTKEFNIDLLSAAIGALA